MHSDRRDLTEGFLFTDQYQLTMAQLYWKHGLAERRAQFDYFFRRYPDYGEHKAGYVITAGLGWLIDWIESTHVRSEDIEVLRDQRDATGQRRFDDGFLSWLKGAGGFGSVTVKAIPEGRVVHAHEPIAIVEGPLAIAQILETSLLNHLNYQTLIATKASRVAEQARGGMVLEFGMRRGPDTGTNAGTRAALIGGAHASSNIGVSRLLGSAPAGTHGHSMVQLFMALGEGERAAFRAYAEMYPDECVLLVDTIDTIESGIPNAIAVFGELRDRGHEPVGIRLDSGDLAHLAVRAARMLNDAGFEEVAIVLSSDLDEMAMWQIRAQIDEEAPSYGLASEEVASRLMFGVGTRLIASHGYPALGGVYKLVAIDDDGLWKPAMKISDTPEKMPIPGDKRVWRVYDDRGLATVDVVASASQVLRRGQSLHVFHPHRIGVDRVVHTAPSVEVEALLEKVYTDGVRWDGSPNLEDLRLRRLRDLERLDVGVRRLINPHRYHVSVTESVKRLQQDLIAQARS
ncbi:MAG: nicotinate phosphoribosyltransferase [Proteobacteria bacterium]|nr:nicotinate phosphoribosyltransferase [Pseudomonadota bacterium]